MVDDGITGLGINTAKTTFLNQSVQIFTTSNTKKARWQATIETGGKKRGGRRAQGGEAPG